MYKSIQITDFKYSVDDIKKNQIEDYKSKIKKAYLEPLQEYLLEDNGNRTIFSADIIQEKLFPTITDNDVFLSHAHADEDEVIRLAIQLENLGLNVFVDSCIWANAFELLKNIDDKYCVPKGWESYSYNARNYSTANIYMILNTALHKMIDQSELFLFLGSETALKVKDVIDGSHKESVRSPWIYSELMFANQVRRVQKREVALLEYIEKSESIMTMDQMPSFDYMKPDLDYSLSNSNFQKWLLNQQSSAISKIFPDKLDLHVLDDFYRYVVKHRTT